MNRVTKTFLSLSCAATLVRSLPNGYVMAEKDTQLEAAIDFIAGK